MSESTDSELTIAKIFEDLLFIAVIKRRLEIGTPLAKLQKIREIHHGGV